MHSCNCPPRLLDMRLENALVFFCLRYVPVSSPVVWAVPQSAPKVRNFGPQKSEYFDSVTCQSQFDISSTGAVQKCKAGDGSPRIFFQHRQLWSFVILTVQDVMLVWRKLSLCCSIVYCYNDDVMLVWRKLSLCCSIVYCYNDGVMLVWRKSSIEKTVSVLQYCVLL